MYNGVAMRTIKINHEGKKTYVMTHKLERFLDKVEKDIKNNRNIEGPFYTIEEVDKYLDSL